MVHVLALMTRHLGEVNDMRSQSSCGRIQFSSRQTFYSTREFLKEFLKEFLERHSLLPLPFRRTLGAAFGGCFC